MTYREAAEMVLRSARKPLTTAEITDIALRRQLIQPQGKTPVATMSATLYAMPAGSPIRRQYEPGRQRAVRGSVRWIQQAKAE